jgi:molybdopterin/thiamine biosynthesis adenylyltransferase
MNDDQLLRYSRHILLDEIDVQGQQRLLDARVLIVGAGGLGCAAALYLAASGVGRLTLIDDDVVELSNLQRQIGHTSDRVGQSKVASLAQAITAINPETFVHPVQIRADATLLADHLAVADVVLDCSDNFLTRQMINSGCVRHHKPLVSGAALRMDGQIAIFDLRDTAAPCYACLFPPDSDVPETQCSTMGVLSPLVGIIGATQAADAIAVLLHDKLARSGSLRLLDASSMEWTALASSKNPACPVCRSSA